MKIHMRPLPTMSLAPPPKPPPTAFQLEIETEQLIKTAQQQQTRLKKLYGAHKNCRDLDEQTVLPPSNAEQIDNLSWAGYSPELGEWPYGNAYGHAMGTSGGC